MGNNGDLSNFERGRDVGATRAIFHQKIQFSYWDFHTQPFVGFTKNGVKREKHPVCGSPVGECLVDARGQRRIGRLIQADRRATLTDSL